jgi:hypothetical protein
MQLNLSFLLQNIPLLLFKSGIQIILTLACPTDVFYLPSPQVNVAGVTTLFNAGLDYVIDNPRYVCTMVVPEDEYTAKLITKYRSPSGVFMNCPSYRALRNSIITGTNQQNIVMNPGVRSLRRCLSGFYSTKHQYNASTNATKDLAYAYLNHAHVPILINTQSYNWRIGSVDFPPRLIYLWQSGSSVTQKVTFHEVAIALAQIAQLYMGRKECVWNL